MAVMLALALAVMSTSASAEGPLPKRERKIYPANPDIMAVDRSVSASYMLSYFYYNEPSANSGVPVPSDYLDYEEGTLKGGKLQAQWMTDSEIYLEGEWAGAEGQIPYTGYFYTVAPFTAIPAKLTSRATTQEYQFKLGKGFNAAERWMLTPYLSFGGRHWTRVVGMGTQSPFNESYNHYFFLFGGRAQWNPWARFVGTVDVGFGSTFRASITDPPDGFNGTKLGSSAIVKAGLDLDGRITDALHIFYGFDFTYFTYGQSAAVYSPSIGANVFEPDSYTRVLNSNFGLRYSFKGLAG